MPNAMPDSCEKQGDISPAKANRTMRSGLLVQDLDF